MTVLTKRDVLEAAAGNKGCLGKAADDEPVFVLRAQDASAPSIVRSWITNAVLRGVNSDKLAAAHEVAFAMDEWQQRHGRKIPD